MDSIDTDGVMFSLKNKQTGRDLTCFFVGNLDAWRLNKKPEPPEFHDNSGNNGISLGIGYNNAQDYWHLSINMSEPAKTHFLIGDLSLELNIQPQGTEEKSIKTIDTVDFRDMSENAQTIRRLVQDSKYTHWKFWLGTVGGGFLKIIGSLLAISFAFNKYKEISEAYPFLRYIAHPVDNHLFLWLLPLLLLIGCFIYNIINKDKRV